MFWVDAESEEEALERHEAGESEMYASECEVTQLGESEVTGTTTLDDTGDV